MNTTIHPVKRLEGEIIPASDKSMSHRAVMLGSLAQGTTIIRNPLESEDVTTTISAFTQMGIPINKEKNTIIVHGKGLHGLEPSFEPLYLGNSGTTMRLLMGILAGQKFDSMLEGDESLSRRPMKRVIEPLAKMGITINALEGNFAPLSIISGIISPINYTTKVASAQVKSAILLAGLYANGCTQVTEPFLSRDHTERMLTLFGCPVIRDGLKVSLNGVASLTAQEFTVPGDISSAAFFIVAALLAKDSCVKIKNVGLNPTRSGLIDVVKEMGANIVIENITDEETEPIGDLIVSTSQLHGITIEQSRLPLLIDEIPIVMVAACFAQGTTKILGADELRVKETDRIHSMTTNLQKMGANIEVVDNDIYIKGTGHLTGTTVDSFLDHRTAMASAIAAIVAEGETTITRSECVSISFPEFFKLLNLISSK